MEKVSNLSNLEIAQVLDRAGDLMQFKGYNDYTRHHDDGSMCALGAIESALGFERDYYNRERIKPYVIKMVEALKLGYAPTFPELALATWSNDLKDGALCVRGFRTAAALIRQEV